MIGLKHYHLVMEKCSAVNVWAFALPLLADWPDNHENTYSGDRKNTILHGSKY